MDFAVTQKSMGYGAPGSSIGTSTSAKYVNGRRRKRRRAALVAAGGGKMMVPSVRSAIKPPPLPKKPRKKALKGEDLIDQAQEIDFAAMVTASGPGVPFLWRLHTTSRLQERRWVVCFSNFEAVRTVSSEYDAPRRSGPNVEQLVAENARRSCETSRPRGYSHCSLAEGQGVAARQWTAGGPQTRCVCHSRSGKRGALHLAAAVRISASRRLESRHQLVAISR